MAVLHPSKPEKENSKKRLRTWRHLKLGVKNFRVVAAVAINPSWRLLQHKKVQCKPLIYFYKNLFSCCVFCAHTIEVLKGRIMPGLFVWKRRYQNIQRKKPTTKIGSDVHSVRETRAHVLSTPPANLRKLAGGTVPLRKNTCGRNWTVVRRTQVDLQGIFGRILL